MKHLKEFELITESDTYTYNKLQFIRKHIKDLRSLIRDVDWKRTTGGEMTDIITSLNNLSELIKK
jgi:hypothetical protein